MCSIIPRSWIGLDFSFVTQKIIIESIVENSLLDTENYALCYDQPCFGQLSEGSRSPSSPVTETSLIISDRSSSTHA
jgi:hypothetical protein